MNRKTILSAAIVLINLIVLSSCSKSDSGRPDNQPEVGESTQNETWIIYNGNQNWSGGIYVLKGNKPSVIDLAGVLYYQLGYSAGGRVLGKAPYQVIGDTDKERGISKYVIGEEGNNGCFFFKNFGTFYSFNRRIKYI